MIIGKAIHFANPTLDIEWYGVALEIHAGLVDKGIGAQDFCDHPDSAIRVANLMKDKPDPPELNDADSRVFEDLFLNMKKGKLEEARTLLGSDRFSAIRGTDSETLPLFHSIEAAKKDWVEFFAGEGAGLNVASKLGMTPLHWAAAAGRAEMVSILLRAGADSKMLNWCLFSAGELAQANEHPKVVEIFEKECGELPILVGNAEALDRTIRFPDLEGAEHLIQRLESIALLSKPPSFGASIGRRCPLEPPASGARPASAES